MCSMIRVVLVFGFALVGPGGAFASTSTLHPGGGEWTPSLSRSSPKARTVSVPHAIPGPRHQDDLAAAGSADASR